MADAVALEIHHSHHAILQDQRHGHFRPDIVMRLDVPRVLVGVMHTYHIARLGGSSGEAFAQRHVVGLDALVVANAEQVAQHFRFAIHRENAESVVIDELAHRAGNLAQQLIQIEN